MSRIREAPSFVGRQLELQWLEASMANVTIGLPQLVLLPGEAGIGKTRLLREFQASARRGGARVCYGRAFEDRALPYLPFEPLFAEFEPDAEPLLRDFFSARGAGARTLPVEKGSDLRARLFASLGHSLFALARRGPCLIVLDDLHWADGPSIELFAHLAFAASDAAEHAALPLAIVASYRPPDPGGPLARAISRCQREEICRTLELTGLESDEVRAMVSELGLPRAAVQLVAVVMRATRGNPLFVQQVAHQLAREGAVEESGGRLVTTADAETLELPEDVTSAVAEHVAELDPACRSALTLASFLGERFELSELCALAELHSSEVLGSLEQALDERLLTSAGQHFEFTHPLVRHVLYRAVSGPRRQRSHKQVADLLQKLSDDPLPRTIEIAHHLRAAGPLANSRELALWTERAAECARDLFAWTEAGDLFEAAACAVSASDPAGHGRCAELHFKAAHCHMRGGDGGPALSQYQRAIEHYERTDDLAGLARARMEWMRAQVVLGTVSYGSLLDTAPLQDALTALGDREPQLRALILEALANVHWTARDPDRAETLARQALAIAEEIGDALLCARASGVLALVQTQALAVQGALETSRASVEWARRSGDRWFEAQRLIRVPMALTRLGRLREAAPVADEACARAKETQNWGEYSLALSNRIELALVRGELDAVEAQARDVLSKIERSSYPWAGTVALPALACARFLRGDARGAEDAIAILYTPGRVFARPAASFESAVRPYRELMAAFVGQPLPSVRSDLEAPPAEVRHRRPLELGSLFRLCSQIEIAAALDNPDLSAQPLAMLHDVAERGLLFSSGWIYLIPRVVALGLGLSGRADEAESWFSVALECASSEGAGPELARALLDRARLRAARGVRDGSGDDLLAAHERIEALGLAPLRARASALARELGVDLPASSRQSDAELHEPRTTELIRRLARGESASVIGRALLLGEESVRLRTRALMQTLGAQSQDELIERAVARGIVPSHPRQGISVRAGVAANATIPRPRIICFTDLEASTQLLASLGDAGARPMFREHEEIVRACLRGHGGDEIQHTGDGFLLSFRSAGAALEFAIDAQRALARRNLAVRTPALRMRIGLDAGEPIAEPDRLFGASVYACARICARARGSQILASEVVRALARGRSLEFRDCGEHSLKGFPEPFRLFEVPWQAETQA